VCKSAVHSDVCSQVRVHEPHRQLSPSPQALSLSHRCKKWVSLEVEPEPEASWQPGVHNNKAAKRALSPIAL
jgi:hypothetical protein